MSFDSTIYEDGIEEAQSVYDVWLKYANERDVFEKHFKEHIDQWATKSPLSIVELGCGAGATSFRIMALLDEAGIEYEYTGVEPYQAQLDMFAQKAAGKENISLIRAGVDDFVPEQEYDVAFAVHSLYYVSNMVDAIKKIDSFSKKAVIVHHGEHGINEVHQQFKEHVQQGAHIMGTYAVIAAALQENGIDYQLDEYESQVDVRSIKEAGNPEGQKLIEFFLERTDLPEQVIEDVRNYFRERPDTMTHEVGIFTTR